VPSNELGQPNIVEVPTVVPTFSRRLSNAHLTPELAKIIDAWPSLPPVAKAGVLAMIDAAEHL
jgi:hypothetical protein